MRLLARSSDYRTPPWGKEDQPPFVNACIHVATSLTPEALLGIVLGVVFAVIVSRPLADEGFVLSFPITTLIVLTILAAIAGVLAAIPPARRAARVDVLRAVTTE